MSNCNTKDFVIAGFILLALPTIPAYITHLLWSLSGLSDGTLDQVNEYLIAGFGIFMPPIGVIHGYYLWFS
jgi:hypothetical protein